MRPILDNTVSFKDIINAENFNEKKELFFKWAEPIIKWCIDYRFFLIFMLTVLVIIVTILVAAQHMPSKGRIIDIYDAQGNKRTKRKKKDNFEEEDFF